MLNRYKFSIGISAYKSLFLEECISSILNQSYTCFELIIINDHSPESVTSVVKEFEDSRIQYFENDKNIGAENLVLNWNECLNKADGDFFIIMGDDDRMEINYLEEFVNLINKYPNLDIYHCRSLIIDENSQPIVFTPSCPEYESLYDNIWHRINDKRRQFISDFVYRTLTLKQLDGFFYMPLAWSSDNISAYRACGDKGIAHINKPIFNYRINRYTISSSGNIFLKLSAISKEAEWFKVFLKVAPQMPMDKIIYNDICKKIDKHILKKRILTLVFSSQGFSMFYFLKCWNQRKNYGLSTLDIVYSILKFLKVKYIAHKFS
jgi:glycosyltransferase involved in cell wall biosynthesis